MHKLVSLALWLSDALVALLLFLMMMVIVLDVSGRFLFHRPLVGSSEMIQYMLVMVIFIGLPAVTARAEHITITLSENMLGDFANRMRRRIVNGIAGVAMVVVGYYMWRYAGLLVQNRDVIGSLLLPLAPAGYLVSVLTFVTGLTFIALIGREGDS